MKGSRAVIKAWETTRSRTAAKEFSVCGRTQFRMLEVIIGKGRASKQETSR